MMKKIISIFICAMLLFSCAVSQATSSAPPIQYKCGDVRASDNHLNDEERSFFVPGYSFVEKEAFLSQSQGSEVLHSNSNSEPEHALAMIYGDAFISLEVGDYLPPGIYVNDSNTSCFIIVERADGTYTKSTYSVNGSEYTLESREQLAR